MASFVNYRTPPVPLKYESAVARSAPITSGVEDTKVLPRLAEDYKLVNSTDDPPTPRVDPEVVPTFITKQELHKRVGDKCDDKEYLEYLRSRNITVLDIQPPPVSDLFTPAVVSALKSKFGSPASIPISIKAPAGVSEFSGPHIAFQPSAPDRLTIRASIPLCSLVAPLAPVSGYVTDHIPGMLISGNTLSLQAPLIVDTIALSPLVHAGVHLFNAAAPQIQTSACFSDCVFLALIGQAFTKYKIKKAGLSYKPTTTTFDPTNFALVFSDDPNHPVMGMDSYTTTATLPSYTTAKNSVDSVVFACWAPWEREFKVDPDTVYYTGASIREDIGSFNLTTTPPFKESELRFTHFGALSVFCNRVSEEEKVSEPKGELYLDLEIEYFDMVPVASTTDVPFTLKTLVDLCYSKDFATLSEVVGIKRSPPLNQVSGYYAVKHPKFSFKVGKETHNKEFKRQARLSRRSLPYTHKLGRTESSGPKQPPKMNRPLSRTPQMSLVHVAAHLHKRRGNLPAQAQAHVAKLMSTTSRKPSGWKNTAKNVLTTLVKEVPVVGGILGELTDAVGGKLFDWIGSLF